VTDQIEQLFSELRNETLPSIIAPGPGAARATVRRKREIRVAAGCVLAVAVAAAGIGTARHHDVGSAAATSSSGPPITIPEPDPVLVARAKTAGNALGDPDRHPWVMATSTTIDQTDYENDINDIGAGKYQLVLFCAGPGRLRIQIKADEYGNEVLATGTVPCSEKPVATRLSVTQPNTGYLRLFAHAEDGAAGAVALSFKFVRA
jgi:hypothetical protein